jgi:tRNA modification GTPase
VGKSSLINALAGYERAIVAPTPGTTRDVVTTLTAIDGWPVELADTAGLRDTEDEIEMAGVALAGCAIASADLVLAVRDASSADDVSPSAESVLPRLRAQTRVIDVWNKIDLVVNRGPIAGRLHANRAVATSAVSGAGLDTLVTAIAQALMPVAPPDGAAVPFHASHLAALEAARIAIDARNAGALCRTLEPLGPLRAT